MRVFCWVILISFVSMVLLEPFGPLRAEEPLWPGEAPAERKTPVGLLDLDARGIASDEAAMLSDRLRIELFRTGAFDVMERNKMKEILEEQNFQLSGCTDQTCAVQVGRLIGVQKMVAGSVGKIGQLYTVSLWMVDVESGRMEKTAVRDYKGQVEELMTTVMRDLAYELTGFHPKTITVTLPGGATLEMVWIEPGTFTMGSPSSESGRRDDEGPQHEVKITRGFWLGKYELTQGQWESVMGTRPWGGEDQVQENPNCPAVYISWDDVQAFIAKLNRVERAAVYRLPTEAEWEYACRAGTTTRWSFGDDESKLKDYAWYHDNACNSDPEVQRWGHNPRREGWP